MSADKELDEILRDFGSHYWGPDAPGPENVLADKINLGQAKQAILDLYISKEAVEELIPRKQSIPYSPEFAQQANSARAEGYNEAIDDMVDALGLTGKEHSQ